jgi:hypothetical protein
VIPILLGTLFFWQLFDDISGGFMFRIESEFQSILDKNMISEELRQEFEDGGNVISPQAVFSVEQAGRSWVVTDEENEYLIRKEEGKLNVYNSKGGFLRTPGGEWKLPNCVGLMVVGLAPVLAVIFSLIRGRADIELPDSEEEDLSTKGRRGGVVAFLLALIPAGVLLVILLSSTIPEAAEGAVWNPVLWSLLTIGIIAMLLSNYVLDKYNTSSGQASWFARWAGILATMDISAFIAVMLIGLKGVSETAVPIRDKLSGVSYIILTAVFLIIIGGLGWCFYRALSPANGNTGIQHPDEVGDEERQTKNSV